MRSQRTGCVGGLPNISSTCAIGTPYHVSPTRTEHTSTCSAATSFIASPPRGPYSRWTIRLERRNPAQAHNAGYPLMQQRRCSCRDCARPGFFHSACRIQHLRNRHSNLAIAVAAHNDGGLRFGIAIRQTSGGIVQGSNAPSNRST